jgi:hypothetical protein
VVGRRNWLIATATTLVVLLAPLCALACLPSAAEATASAESGGAPCHEPAPNSTPSEPMNSHDDCGCEASNTALVQSPQASLNSASCSALSTLETAGLLDAGVHWVALARFEEADLPTSDILLLKSTLLI